MNEEKETKSVEKQPDAIYALPAEPVSVGKVTAVGVVLGPIMLGIATGLTALASKIPALKNSKLWMGHHERVMKQHTVSNYAVLAIGGGILGNVMGGHYKTEQELKTENAELKNQILTLANDKTFAQTVAQEKLEKKSAKLDLS